MPQPGSTGYRYPGDIRVNKINLISNTGEKTDINSLLLECNIFEDIKKSYIHGTIVIDDALNLVSTFPIVGEEEFELSISLPGDRFKIYETFQVYKISNRESGKQEKTQIYVLEFISKDYYDNLNTTVSKSYSDKPVSEIVSNILEKILKTDASIETDETLGVITYTIPNLTPLGAIRQLKEDAISTRWKTEDFMFYKSHEGYHFVSLSNLLNKPSLQTYYYQHQNLDKKGRTDEEVNDSFIIENFEILKDFDITENVTSGMYNSTLIGVDILSKNISTTNVKYNDVVDSLPSLEKHPVSKESKFNQYGSKTYLKTVDINNPTDTIKQKAFILGKIQKNKLTNIHMNVWIPGDIHRKPGDVITLVLPSPGGTNDLQNNDKYYSGRYLVTSVRHKFSKDQSATVMEVVRDSHKRDIRNKK